MHRVCRTPPSSSRRLQLLYGPNSQTPMTPTATRSAPAGVRGTLDRSVHHRTTRFSDRASTIHAYGVSGGSNQFLKGKFNITLFPPADPDATPTPGDPYANQLTGVAGLFPQDILQSSSTLVLDLNGTSSPGSGSPGLPSQLTWTYDFNTSAGAYAAPVGFVQGAGTLDLKWIPDAHPVAGTMGSGKVIITFQGLINGSQLVSPISKLIS